MINTQKLTSNEVWKEKRKQFLMDRLCQRCQNNTPEILRKKSVTEIIKEKQYETVDDALNDIDLFFDEYVLICRDCQYDIIKMIVDIQSEPPISSLSEMFNELKNKDLF